MHVITCGCTDKQMQKTYSKTFLGPAGCVLCMHLAGKKEKNQASRAKFLCFAATQSYHPEINQQHRLTINLGSKISIVKIVLWLLTVCICMHTHLQINSHCSVWHTKVQWIFWWPLHCSESFCWKFPKWASGKKNCDRQMDRQFWQWLLGQGDATCHIIIFTTELHPITSCVL